MIKSVLLSEVCNIVGGYAFKSTDYKESGVPLVRISNIVNGGVVFNNGTVYLDPKYFETHKPYLVEKGDVLIALSGATTGKYGIYNSKEPCLLNQRIGLIKGIESEDLLPKYFYYYLGILRSEILRKAAGAAQPNISTKEIGNFKISLPPPPNPEKNRCHPG